jgi:hypothetical protein
MVNPPALHIGERGQEHRLPVWRKGVEQGQVPSLEPGAALWRPFTLGLLTPVRDLQYSM